MRKFLLASTVLFSTTAYATEQNPDPTFSTPSAWMQTGTHWAVSGGTANATGAIAMEMLMANGTHGKKGHTYHYSYDLTNYVSGIVEPTIGLDMTTAAPAYTPRPAVDINGLAPIDDTWSLPLGTEPAAIPGDMGSDPMGAIRFEIRGGGVIAPIDPEVLPTLDARSHLHSFMCSTNVTPTSTYATLRAHGGTNCGSDSVHPLNRSSYWIPAMLDGNGHAYKPFYGEFYYKRQPASSSWCNPASLDFIGGAGGGCVGLPHGIQYVFGYNSATGLGGPMDDVGGGPQIIKYNCASPTEVPVDIDPGTAGTQSGSNDLRQLYSGHCPIGSQWNVQFTAGNCWDGANLDSPTHRTHVVNPSVVKTRADSSLFYACDNAHPYAIPDLQFAYFYVADQNLVNGTVHLSSDEMVATATPGATAHFDYIMAWKPSAIQAMVTNCIDGHLSGSSGNLCNGTKIAGDNGKPSVPNHNITVPLSDFGYGRAGHANGTYSGEFTAVGNGPIALIGIKDFATGLGFVGKIDNYHVTDVTNLHGPKTVTNH